MNVKKLYFPEKIASHMKNRELAFEIKRMALSLNKYLRNTPIYKQPEYIKVLKTREKWLFKTETVGKKNKRKVPAFKFGTSGLNKDALIKRYGILVKATKEARRTISAEKGIKTLKERLGEKGYTIDEKTLLQTIEIMRESGLLEYEDSDRVLTGIIDYVTTNDFDSDDIIQAIQDYIDNQSQNQAEISTKDFFNKLREVQAE